MFTFAPLQNDVTADITAETESEMEALIKEARRRTRRRRTALATAAGATVLALAAAFAVLSSSPGEQAASPAGGASRANEGAATTFVAETDLVAALYVHHFFSSGGDVWLYLYDDGRLIQFGAEGWEQQRLTQQGVGMVRDMILDSGIFDAAPEVRSPEDEGCCGLIQLRLDGELVSVPHSWEAPGQVVEAGEFPERYRVTPSFDPVMERLGTLAQWLPDAAWTEADVIDYRPMSYVVCGWGENGGGDLRHLSTLGGVPELLPASASAILRDAAPLPAIPADADHWYAGEKLLPWDECVLLPAADARALARALPIPVWEGSLTPSADGSFEALWQGREVHVGLFPVLPHGVPGLTPG